MKFSSFTVCVMSFSVKTIYGDMLHPDICSLLRVTLYLVTLSLLHTCLAGNKAGHDGILQERLSEIHKDTNV